MVEHPKGVDRYPFVKSILEISGLDQDAQELVFKEAEGLAFKWIGCDKLGIPRRPSQGLHPATVEIIAASILGSIDSGNVAETKD